MSLVANLRKTFDQEMTTTRRVLERVPGEKGDWKPHPKSFALGHLAQLVSWMPGWITNVVTATELDLSAAPGYSLETTDTLLAGFDRNVREAREGLAKVSDEDLAATWSLKRGSQVFMAMPRAEVLLQHLGHISHHRGQLTVYLRLVDVPVPSIYGPTADEGWGG